MNRQTIISQLLILLLAALLVTTAAAPAQAQAPRPALLFGTPSPLVIPAAAFSSDGYEADSFFFYFVGGFIAGKNGSSGCVKAPAYLPKWATVTTVFASVYDNDDTYDAWVELNRVDNYSGSFTQMAYLKTSGTNTHVQTPYDDTIISRLVVYPNYSYYVDTCLLTSEIHLYSVRIYYIGPYELFMPSVKK